MIDRISPDDFVAVMNEVFERGQELTFTPTGRSMLPMLNGKDDTVTFSKKPDRLKKYDVAFYRRPLSGQLVLHRMVGFDKSGGYIFSGDGQYYLEYGITDDDILALMTSFTRKGKKYGTDDFSYRFYIRRMMLKKRLRMLLGKGKRGIKKFLGLK